MVSLHSDAEDQLEDDLVVSLHLEDDLVSMHLRQEDKLGNLEDFEESDVESDDLEFESDLKTKLEEVEKTSINVLEEEGEVAVEDEEVADEKEEVADEEEEGGAELVDDDNNKQKPQFIPRRGLFYEHDNRSDPGDNEFSTNQEEDLARTEREKKKKTKGKEVKWQHDKFMELEQLLSTLEGSSSNKVSTSERQTTERRAERTSLKEKSSFEKANSAREGTKGRPMRGIVGTKRGGNKGPGKELGLGGWGGEQQKRGGDKSEGWKGRRQGGGVGERRWGEQKSLKKESQGGEGGGGRGEGVEGGWQPDQVNQIKSGDKPQHKSSISAQWVESKVREVPVKYSNQRRDNPRRVQAREQSGARRQEKPTPLTSSSLGTPLCLPASLTSSLPMSQLNINAAVFKSSISSLQLERPNPMLQLPYPPNFIQKMPESTFGQNNLPQHLSGFEIDPQSGLLQLVRNPLLEMMSNIGFHGQATIGFLDQANNGFTNQGNAYFGHNAMMPRANFFYPTNNMITPNAS